MKRFLTWLAVIFVVCILLPFSANVSFLAVYSGENDSNEIQNEEEAIPIAAEEAIAEEVEEPYYPEFPELPPPPAPESPFYAVASPPPSYINDENRASRIRLNTSCVVAIDSPEHMSFVTLGQNFLVRGGLYEDNNSNGKNDTGDLPIPNARLHIRWAHSPSQVEVMTDTNGHFQATVPNDNTNLPPQPLPLEIEFWGQWTINGSAYYEIPRNITKNIPGFDDDGDNPAKSTDGIDNDGDWRGWDGSSWNDDTNHDGNKSFDYDGVQGFDDDGDGVQDEETLNGVDDDGDGLVDEDTDSGDVNGDGDGNYDPEPNIDEGDEGIDEEGVPNGQDSDGDTMIDEDCLLPFVPRKNVTTGISLIIQHRTEVSLSVSPKNAQIGDQVSLSGQLLDPDTSTPVTSKWMIIKFHDEPIDYQLTDGEGKFSLNYVIPSEINGKKIDVGRREFQAMYDRNYKPDNTTYFASSSNEVDVSIKRPSQIEITNVEKDVYLQGTITITGKVTDETGAAPLFKIKHDDGSTSTVDSSDYKITLMWGKSAASWAPPPKPGFLGPEGNFSIKIQLDNPLQPLGRVEVTVTFTDLTDKYYLPSQTTDEFIVRAHSRVLKWEEVKGFHRGDTAYIRGQLVMQEGSITKGLAEAQLEARWGPTGSFEELSELTRADGDFTFVHEVEAGHALGPIVVYMRFDGTQYLQGYIDGFDHTQPFAHKTFYVIAQPELTMEGGDIIKGETFTFTGQLLDDTDTPMVNQYVEIYFSESPIINKQGEWDPQDQPIAFIPTDSTGKFEYDHVVDQDFPVGKAYGAARFKGFQPPYNASNAYDEATTFNVEFNVSAHTVIIIDEHHIGKDLFRGRDFVITGKMRESFKGALVPLEPVAPLRGETLNVNLYIKPVGVPGATEIKIGSDDLDNVGSFDIISTVPADLEISDQVELTLVFEKTIRYEQITNTSTHKLWGYIFFDRAAIIESFPHKDEKGRPAVYEKEFNHKSDEYQGPWTIRVPVFEDISGRAPPPVPNATIFLNISEAYFVNSSVALTDSDGVATFQFVNPLQDKDYPDRIKLLHRDKERYILEVTVTFVGSSGLQMASTSFNMSYYPTEPPPQPPFLEKYGTVIGILIIITIILVALMAVLSSYYIKQQRLRGLKRIIKRAADQLIAGDQYRATIYKSYKKLSAHLRRYGYLRREAETFREFENAIRQALPIDRISMHRFLDLLEEARYSTHKIGENQRQAAISNLRAIEGSLSKIIIDEEAAMRALRKLEEEEKAMAAAETEIVVKPGAEEGVVPGGGPGGTTPPSLPPKGEGPPKLPPGK